MAAPVSFIRWILIMASVGRAGAVPGRPRSRLAPASSWYRFRRSACCSATNGRARADPPPEVMTMRFYTQQHRFYCGVDLHTRTLSLCVLNSEGAIVLEATMPPEPERLLAALAPYRDGLVVGCECLFAWYWLADRSA